MSRRKVDTPTQIIALFKGLSDEHKRMVLFAINAITSDESPKSSAPVAAQRSSRRTGAKPGNESSTVSSETEKEDAGNAAQESLKNEKSKSARCVAIVPGLDVECRQPKENGIHDPNGGYGGYHEFEAGKAKRAAK